MATPFDNRNAFNKLSNSIAKQRDLRTKFRAVYNNDKKRPVLSVLGGGSVSRGPSTIPYMVIQAQDYQTPFIVAQNVNLPTVSISNVSSSVFNGTYVARTIDGQVRYGQTDYGLEDFRYIFFDTGTSKWSFFNSSIVATLPISITESDGFWTAGVNDWTGTLASLLQGATYTTSNL